MDIAWCCSRLARFVQQHCAWACAIFRFSISNMSQQDGQTRSTCCTQQCCDMLRSNVAIVWSGLANAGGTMLGYFMLKYFDRLLALSPGQTIATCQRNISQHYRAQHVARVWPPCWDVLRHIGCCCLKIENGQIWGNNTQHVATHRNTVAKCAQHVSPNNVAAVWPGLTLILSSSSGKKGTEVKLSRPL